MQKFEAFAYTLAVFLCIVFGTIAFTTNRTLLIAFGVVAYLLAAGLVYFPALLFCGMQHLQQDVTALVEQLADAGRAVADDMASKEEL